MPLSVELSGRHFGSDPQRKPTITSQPRACAVAASIHFLDGASVAATNDSGRVSQITNAPSASGLDAAGERRGPMVAGPPMTSQIAKSVITPSTRGQVFERFFNVCSVSTDSCTKRIRVYSGAMPTVERCERLNGGRGNGVGL